MNRLYSVFRKSILAFFFSTRKQYDPILFTETYQSSYVKVSMLRKTPSRIFLEVPAWWFSLFIEYHCYSVECMQNRKRRVSVE